MMMTRQEQIEEMLKDLNGIVIRSDDAEIVRILRLHIYLLEEELEELIDELKEEKEKLAIDKAD